MFFVEDFEMSWRRTEGALGRTQTSPVTVAVWSSVPAADRTRRTQLVDPAATGARVSFASAGNALAIPSIVQVPDFPTTVSRFVAEAAKLARRRTRIVAASFRVPIVVPA